MSKKLKGIAAILAIVLVFAGVVWAASVTIYGTDNALPFASFEYTYTLASDNTATAPGAGTEYTFGVPMSKFSCVVSHQSTTTPTTSTMSVEGSLDGTYWQTYTSVTTTLSTGNFMVSNATDSLFTRLRPNNSVMTKGTGTSWSKIKCLIQQH